MLAWFLRFAIVATPSAQAGSLAASALEAARLEFHRDGIGDATGQRTARLYKEACQSGHALSCQAPSWREGGLSAAAIPARTACESGDGIGCLVAGWAALEAQEDEAQGWFARGCEAGLPRACAEEARLSNNAAALEAACTEGLGMACAARAALAPETEAGHHEALHWLELGCARTDPASCFARAELALRDPHHALPEAELQQLYSQSCKQGHAPSCRTWAHAHLSWGLGLDRSTITGIDPLVRACDLGDVRACGEAGGELVRGRAGNHRVEQGLRILQLGCSGGDGSSCATLATTATALSLAKTELPHLELDASALAERACELRHPGACGWLGLQRWLGLAGGTPDAAAAEELLRESCPKDPDSCDVLGLIQSVRGAAPGPAWEQACAGGVHLACVRLAAPDHAVHTVLMEPRPVEPDARPAQALVPEGLAVLRAIDARDHAAALCRRGLTPTCRADATAQLLPMDPRELDLRRGAAWLPLLEGACEDGQTKACLVEAALHRESGQEAAAVEAWTGACVPRGLGHLACEALEQQVHGSLPAAAEAALCLAGRTERCAYAAKALGSGELAETAAAAGCAAADRAACKAFKKIAGEEFSGPAPLPTRPAAQNPEPEPLPEAVVLGGLSPSAVDTFEAAEPALRACVAAGYAARGMWEWEADLRVEVGSAGQVLASTVRPRSAAEPGVVACMDDVIGTLRFPGGGAGVLSARLHVVQQPPELPEVEPAEHHHHH